MAETRRVAIESPAGRRAGVTETDYRRKKVVLDGEETTYEAAGWKITGYEDGGVYEPPKPARSSDKE